jgi:hypothetical protein
LAGIAPPSERPTTSSLVVGFDAALQAAHALAERLK